jgi:hypothetical protein
LVFLQKAGAVVGNADQGASCFAVRFTSRSALLLPAGCQHHPAGLGVFLDIGECFLHYAVQVKLIFGPHPAKVQGLFYVGDALDPRPLTERGTEADKGIFEGKPGEIRRHKLGTDLPNPGAYNRLLADDRLFVRRLTPGPGKKPQFGKYHVVKLAGNAPPFRFLTGNHQPGKGKILGFPFLGSAHGQIEITDQGYEDEHDDHKKPQEAEMDFKFRGRYNGRYFRYHTGSILPQIWTKGQFRYLMEVMETPPRFHRLVSLFLCIAGAALNIIFSRFNGSVTHLPLFIDTIFTIALTFSRGPFWGILTGVLTHLAFNSIFPSGWLMYLYTLCSIATVLITVLFIRLFPGELGFLSRRDAVTLKTIMRTSGPRVQGNWLHIAAKGGLYMDRVMVLMMLSFSLCIAMSVQGGLTAAVIEFLASSGSSGTEGPELLFKLTLLRRNLPLVGVEILSRIPLNVIDRLVSVFGAYGIAALLNYVPVFQNRA